jgi:hypothetical protein
MCVLALRSARSKRRVTGQDVVFENDDALEVVGQDTSSSQSSDTRSDNNGPLAKLS